MSRERRSSPRIPFDEDVIVYAAGRRMACRGRDLSTSGIGLLPEEGARPGLHVIVDMGIGGSESIAVEGYVVRQERFAERYAWGVQFHGLSPRVQHKLDDHVARVARQAVHRHNQQPAADRVKRQRPDLPDLPERAPTPSSVALPAMPMRRTPTSTEQRLIVGPFRDPTPTPAPAPAFEVPPARPGGPRDSTTRAAPSPAFTYAPQPVPALPRREQRAEPPKPAPSIPVLEPLAPSPEPRISSNSFSPPNVASRDEPKPRRSRRPSPARGGAAVAPPAELALDVHQRETALYPRDGRKVDPVDDEAISDEALADFVNEFLKD